jgi:hypothetical protein
VSRYAGKALSGKEQHLSAALRIQIETPCIGDTQAMAGDQALCKAVRSCSFATRSNASVVLLTRY